MHMHMNSQMASKTIVVTTDVYEMLRRQKLPDESFSDVLRRLASGRGRLSPHFGALAHEPEEFFRGMEEAIDRVNRASDIRRLVRR